MGAGTARFEVSVNPKCPYCKGLGWVCENHPHLAWSDDEAGCQCVAGMLCECNRAEGHEEPDLSQVIVEAAQMPFMITNAQKAKLRAIGYDDDAISKMTPEQAHRNLQMN
jgi:hypothetical protein